MPTDITAAPFIDQYFGLWMFESSLFWSQFELMRKCDLHLHLQSDAVANAQSAAKQPAKVENKIATIQIGGKMMKQASSMGGGTSTVAVRRQVRAAMADSEVAAVALHIDSGGGTAAGTEELADDVASLAKVKPVLAFIEDLGASAAYWVASQATHISVNAAGLVGSIGTYGVVYDQSGQAAMEGIKAYVVNAGKYKGMGTPGTEVTQDQLAEWKRNVDAINSRFLSGVARGRNMNVAKVEEIADGRVHIGSEAMAMGLVDSVESFDAAFSRLQFSARKKKGIRMLADHIQPETNNREVIEMSAETIKPVAATSKEIKASCPGCSADFILAQLDKSATISDVKDAWSEQLANELKAERDKSAAEAAKVETLTNEVAELKKKPGKSGVSPVGGATNSGDGAGDGVDPIATWNELVAAEFQVTKNRQTAMRNCVVNNPDAHKAFIEAYNSTI